MDLGNAQGIRSVLQKRALKGDLKPTQFHAWATGASAMVRLFRLQFYKKQ